MPTTRAIVSNRDSPPSQLNLTPHMIIFIIILFCLSLGYLIGYVHAEQERGSAQSGGTFLFCLAICIALIIPLIYQVGRWVGFWA